MAFLLDTPSIEVYLLKAIALQKHYRGDVTPTSREPFERALALAEPVGYVMLFLEEKRAVIPLLNAVAAGEPHRNAWARLTG
jgi:hypothetical protein